MLYKNNKATIRAFKAFGLDSRNPYHWRRLLFACTGILFPVTKSGRKKLWDRRQRHQLLADFEAEKSKAPALTDDEICKRLHKHKYKAHQARTLRNRLTLARAELTDR